MKRLLFTGLLLGAFPVQAYLDPASGSMLFSALFGIIAAGFFVLKSGYYKALSLVGRRHDEAGHVYGVVCYSEGSQYWATFRPLIASLNELGCAVTYFTSDGQDTAFGFAGELLKVKYIGRGNQAWARLNFLNADVCILTTPGLDVLQIKRSRGVGQYVHVVHSAADVHTYKLFSFDYYDVVLCSGQHQIDSIRKLEAKRKTSGKQLLLTGCLYYDELVRQRDRQLGTSGRDGKVQILIAPTWGENGLLGRFGAGIVTPLLEQGFQVTIRPHPQSYVVEKKLVDALRDQLAVYEHLTWDRRPDNFVSLSEADIMISDISLVVLDFAFVFRKPVITIASEPVRLGTEGFDLDTQAFELSVIEGLGKTVSPEAIASLPDVVAQMIDSRRIASRVEAIQQQMVVNFGNSGPVAARQVLALSESCQSGSGSSVAVA